MAMVLELAQYVASVKDRLKKNVLLVFQPAEETTGGAQFICQSGVFAQKNVKAIYGFHLWPDLPLGQPATRPGPLLAASCEGPLVHAEVWSFAGRHGAQRHCCACTS